MNLHVKVTVQIQGRFWIVQSLRKVISYSVMGSGFIFVVFKRLTLL